MRFIFISDTHSLHSDKLVKKLSKYINPQKENVLIHAGDCTNLGKEHEIIDFVYWLQNLEGFSEKIFIAGNHDFGFEYKGPWLTNLINSENLSQSDCTYLEDGEIIIQNPKFSKPIKIYGSPWQPWFYDWAFNLPRNGEELEKKWNDIPDDTTILITHGPPFGHLDHTPTNIPVGCEILRERIDKVKPLIHVFGHIHNGYGVKLTSDTLFVNASICTEKYKPINKPIVIDIEEVYGDFICHVVDY